jgi:predicted nucleotidyltransferase
MIILYGSQAGSDARPSSDIDIAVVVDRIEGDFLDAQAALYRLRREIDDRIEPVLIEEGRDESGFLASIRACGEILFP